MKTIFPSLRNIEWRTLKTETNRINQMLPYISTNNISELNDLIDAGVKLMWEVRMETQTKKSTKTSQNGKKKILEYMGREWNRHHEKR